MKTRKEFDQEMDLLRKTRGVEEAERLLANICQAAKLIPMERWPDDFKQSVFKAREWIYARSSK